MKTPLLPLPLVLVACASAPAPAPQAAETPLPEPPPEKREVKVVLPSADALFERALEVAGGREALLALEGYRATGKMESPQGISGTMTVIARAPHFSRSTLVMGPGLRFEEGFDGEVAWSNDPVSGPRVKSGAERADVERRADLHGGAHYAQHYPERATRGETEFAGAPAWAVDVTTSSGGEETHYFHRETGRDLGFSAKVQSAMGEVPIVVSYADWRTVGGIELPFVIRNEVATTIQQVMTLEEVSVESAAPEAFKPPEAVRALVPAAGPSDAAPAPQP